jgi:intracellular septation protein
MDQPAPQTHIPPEPSGTPRPSKASGWVGAAVDYGPLLVFFAAYEIGGLRAATIAVIAATAAALLAGWLVTRRFAFMPALTLVIVGVLGGLTLYLNDPDFIKMKPTIVYLLFAGIIAAELLSGRPLLGRAMTAAMPPMTAAGKRLLLLRFMAFFIVMAVINEVARRVLSTDHWVVWKVFGGIGATFLFVMAQIPLMQRHKLLDAESETPTEI